MAFPVCPIPGCGRSFFRTALLLEHQYAEHSEFFPYACRYCSARFTTLGEMHKHCHATHRADFMRDGLPHACDRCTRRFASMAGLTRHVRSVHASVPQAMVAQEGITDEEMQA